MENSVLCPFEALFAVPLRNGLTRPKAIRGTGVKMINMGEIFAHTRIGNIPMARVPLSKNEAENYLLEPGDLLFARQSLVLSGAGKCSIFVGASEDVTFESHLIRARLNHKIADSAFYFYFFNSILGRKLIESIVEQVAAAGIRGRDLAKLLVPNPALSEQKAIARILSSLDDKIELNQQMNQTLEAKARAIFKSWFVDFDPVRANIDERQLVEIDVATADLFPNEFENSPLGKIPKGWRVGTISQEFSITMGQSPPSSTYNEEGNGVPFYQGRKDFGFRYPTQRVYCSAPTRFAYSGDTLVSVRAPVGDINMANQTCCIGRGVAAVCHKQASRSYTYYSMRGLTNDFKKYEAEGTVFGSITKEDFHSIPCIIPPAELVIKFEKSVFPLDQIIEIQEQQSLNLATLRDTLLPKLMSGEIRVKEAEKILEAA